MAVEWYIWQGDQEVGPISSSHLKLMADQREIKPETRIKQGAAGPWIAAGTIEDLFAVYEHARPAPSTGSPPVRPSTDVRHAEAQPAAQQTATLQDSPTARPAGRQPAPQPQAPQQPATYQPSQQPAGQPLAPQPQPAAAPQTPAPQPASQPAPQPEDQTLQWYVQSPDGRQYGPAAKAQLDAWVQEGRVQETCLLWHAGWDQWRWAATVYPQLARPAFASAPAGPAPAAAPAGPVAARREGHAPAAASAAAPTRTAAPKTAPPGAGPDPLIGQTLGRFEVRELIGRGSLGAVYKARQPALDRMIAIRVLPGVRDPQAVERLRRDLRAAAALNHPNIVEIHDMGEQRGCAFIVMEYVEGGSLADLIHHRGRVPVSRGLEIMKQAAAALAVAHAAGVVHRDIKPSNLLLSPKGLAKLGDFGLTLGCEVNLATAASGPAPSSAYYVSPEAVRGQPVDARSDLYSLGATFYHALCGRPPLEGATGAEVARRHVAAQPAPLAQAAPDLPPSLTRVIDRLLAKDPAARFQTAGELLAALNQVAVPQALPQPVPLGSQPAGAAPAAADQAAPLKPGPSILLLIGAGLGGAAAILVVVALLYFLFFRSPAESPAPPEPEPPPASAPAEPAS